MPYGLITRLERRFGYGFLVDDSGMDWFFVREGVRGAAFDEIWVDERVGFSSEWTASGPRAIDIHFEQSD